MEASHFAADAYHEEQVLLLNIESSQEFLKDQSSVQIRVQKLEQPWTLSCGMVAVLIHSADGESNIAFLKLFDRRWAHQLRSDKGIPPWTAQLEAAYAEFLQSEDDWTDGENEAFLAYKLRSLADAERTTYAALQECQGKTIPRLLATLALDLPSRVLVPDDMMKYGQVQGLLLEYLPGFTLSSLDQHAPQSAWQGVLDQAVNITRGLGDFNILNADVRPGNFVVVPAEEGEYRVFMIDFGQCRLRRPDEPDSVWGRAKWQQDEEGAIGMVMEHRLRETEFEYEFEHSLRYLEWAPGEDD